MKNWMSIFLVLLAFGSKIVVAGEQDSGRIFPGSALSGTNPMSTWSTLITIDENEEEKACPVCIEDFSDKEMFKLNACQHNYCKPCLEKHAMNSNCCPVCNRIMNDRVDPVKDKNGDDVRDLSERAIAEELADRSLDRARTGARDRARARDSVLFDMPLEQRVANLERLITECDDLIEHLNHSRSELLSNHSCFPLFVKIGEGRSEFKRVKRHLESVKGIKKSFEKMSQCPGNPGHPGGSFFNYFRTDVGIFEKLKSEIIGQQYTFEIGEVVS